MPPILGNQVIPQLPGAPSPLTVHVRAVVEQRNKATGHVMFQYQVWTQDYMRQHARWKDRTGRARRTLQSWVHIERLGILGRFNRWDLILGYGVSYGKWLETHKGAAYGHRAGMSEAELMERRNAGILAIIWPTLDVWWPRLWRSVRQARERAR